MCHSTLHQDRARAFTLIELLVVIGIIAILASILVPVISTASAQRDAMKCSANLRQLGTGITGYASDHDGHLPGPVNPLIYPAYTANGQQKTALASLIATYIGVDTTVGPSPTVKTETVTTCPAFNRLVKSAPLPSYVLNFADALPDMNQVPWGDPSGLTQPVQLSALTNWADTKSASATYTPSPTGQKDLSRTWAIKDVDLQAFENMVGIGGIGGLPDKPVHGDYRCALFYDWHVGKIDLHDNPK